MNVANRQHSDTPVDSANHSTSLDNDLYNAMVETDPYGSVGTEVYVEAMVLWPIDANAVLTVVCC